MKENKTVPSSYKNHVNTKKDIKDPLEVGSSKQFIWHQFVRSASEQGRDELNGLKELED